MPQMIHTAKGPIHAQLVVPGSKSITRRALLLAALAEGVSEISGLPMNKHTKALLSALRQLGISVQLDEKMDSCVITGGNGEFPQKEGTVWCDDTKSVTRFLLSACAATPGVYYFDGSRRLVRKRISPLLNILRRQGAQFIPSEAHKLPFTLVGADSLEGGGIILDNSLTSQLTSALLMIAPYARSSFNFTVTNGASQPYLNMTCAMMAEFGVLVHRVHQGQFMVPVPQRYQSHNYTIEPDLSLAVYFFAGAAITGGETTISSIKRCQSKQPEVKFLSLLEQMGCRVTDTHSGLSVKGPIELQGIDISMRDFSDTFLLIAAIAPFAKTPTRISNIDFLRHKEAKRIQLIKTHLIKMGVNIESGEDWIKIYPAIPNGCAVVEEDTKIAMALSIIGLKVPNVIIYNDASVTKNYPCFFPLLAKLTEEVSACA